MRDTTQWGVVRTGMEPFNWGKDGGYNERRWLPDGGGVNGAQNSAHDSRKGCEGTLGSRIEHGMDQHAV